MATVIRPHGFSGAVSSEGLHSHAASPVATEGLLVSGNGRPSQPHPLVADLHQNCAVVASGGTVDVRCSTSGSAPIPVVVYRHIFIFLGGSSARFDGLGGMVRGGVPVAHQCVRNESGGTRYNHLPASVSRPGRRPDERQRVCCRLSPASGRHSVSTIVPDGVRHHSMDQATFSAVGGSVHPWKEQRSGRSGKSARSDSSDRVVPVTLSVRGDLPSLRQTST